MGLTNTPHAQHKKEEHLAESLRLLTLSQELFSLKPPWADAGVQSNLSRLARDLANAVAGVNGRLLLGLLGGTGVGKSTLISALAGEAISVVGPIRPLTSQPLIYRHQDFPTPPNFQGEEVIHQVEGLRSLAIIDFPDFDSLRTEHHQVIQDFVPQLDLVVWLTDYHKYADLRFYEVMQGVSEKLGGQAQVVLLNKIDELAGKPWGQAAIGEILDSFSQLLARTNTWSGSKPWPVSAAQALSTPLNPQAGGLGPLRKLLDELGQEKLRLTMKMDNLDARNQNFKKNIHASAKMEEWDQQAGKLTEFINKFKPQPAIKGDMNLLSVRRHDFIEPQVVSIRQRIKGPLALFTDLWDFIFSRFKAQRELSTSPPSPPEALGFTYYLAGCHADLTFMGATSNYRADQTSLKAGQIIQQAFEHHMPSSVMHAPPKGILLWVWPLAIAFILIWAETGGKLGGPSALTVAGIKVLVPWLIFGFLGEITWSRFIWFRVRRKLEHNFNQVLAEAEEKLLELSRDQIADPVVQARDNLQRISQLLIKILRPYRV